MTTMIRQWLLLIILFISFCSEVYAESECKLLGRIDNDLWIIDSSGKPAQCLTYDGAAKTSMTPATWSPNGKFIAYSIDTPYGEEKAIFIVDNAGREINKIIVDPKSEHWEIRYIERLVWRTLTNLWSDSNVGPHGGYIDVWKLDPTLSLPAKHEKRITAMSGGCELSPNNKYMACISYIDDEMQLEISDTDKKEYPDANYYFDRNPRKIELKNVIKRPVRDIRFTADNDNIILTNDGGKYKYNRRRTNYLKLKNCRLMLR